MGRFPLPPLSYLFLHFGFLGCCTLTDLSNTNLNDMLNFLNRNRRLIDSQYRRAEPDKYDR